MNSITRRTLTPGRIVALSRQGERWWPHSSSPSCANTFREKAATAPTIRLGNIPTLVALPLAAASVASMMSAREASTYVLQSPLQASVTSPVLATSAPATVVVDPIADRDRAPASDFHIPFAEPADDTSLPPLPELPPLLNEKVTSIIGKRTEVDTNDTTSVESLPIESNSEFVDPFIGLELEQESPDDAGPSSGLLPDLDDLSMEEFVPPANHRPQSKLAQYQQEFPEIFKISRTSAHHSAHKPAASAKDPATRRKVREAVSRAERWREKRGNATNERRSQGLLGSLKRLFKPRS